MKNTWIVIKMTLLYLWELIGYMTPGIMFMGLVGAIHDQHVGISVFLTVVLSMDIYRESPNLFKKVMKRMEKKEE